MSEGTRAVVFAEDVREAARLTYNEIITRRNTRVEELVILRRELPRGLKWLWRLPEEEYRKHLKTTLMYRQFEHQCVRCKQIIALCDLALLRDPTTTIALGIEDVSFIEWGWSQMYDQSGRKRKDSVENTDGGE